ncbi:hypothetical protein [Mesorhizobium retamae]|uniref:SMI1/KNR4 family protein n=1 Tax=Mesorhizobium retamae TaxID=2912854 RepID=A0ABS9QPC4_9HYPH|nr:hypothetical protein [Mesorhizobium sp. IRAMC:0171]MCG7509267.1 hypothetical protein [Mesorhizobium sp. IRAMC:0171]
MIRDVKPVLDMTDSLFDEALDDKRLLRPSFLTQHQYAARVFPDVLDKDEFERLAAAGQTGEPIIIHHGEFGAPEEMMACDGVDNAWKSLFEVSHEDIILEFAHSSLFAWIPAGERLYVVFGPQGMIASLGEATELKQAFDEYVEESGLTEQGKRFLLGAYERYTL